MGALLAALASAQNTEAIARHDHAMSMFHGWDARGAIRELAACVNLDAAYGCATQKYEDASFLFLNPVSLRI
jgi:hypothetical protein